MKFSRMSTDVLIRESRIILKFPEWLPIFSGTPDSEDTLIIIFESFFYELIIRTLTRYFFCCWSMSIATASHLVLLLAMVPLLSIERCEQASDPRELREGLATMPRLHRISFEGVTSPRHPADFQTLTQRGAAEGGTLRHSRTATEAGRNART